MNAARRRFHGTLLGLVGLSLCAGAVQAERISDIRNTRHNLSATIVPTLPGGASRDARATSESQVCVFCHTPHHSTVEPQAPLWNRTLSGATYVPYSSSSIEATDLGQPGGKSKLCLSCHDGTLALGQVNVLNRVFSPAVGVTTTGPGGTIPPGLGETTGYTRRLGIDLTNDHPISFTYDTAQFNRDGELVDPAAAAHLGRRDHQNNLRATLPLDNDKVECVSCHDPHVRDTSGEQIKFLRVNRFQTQPPLQGSFAEDSDILCLGCHDKAGWAGSAHANSGAGNETYTAAAADLREFPAGTQVWQAACLNCHDPHAVQGTRRLLRGGTDGPLQLTGMGARYRDGGNPAIEETCYACHSADGAVLQGQGGAGFEVPDIKTDFTTMLRHMPIASADQPAGSEVHDIGTFNAAVPNQRGKDFIEDPANLGKGNLTNRHAECTDCHNPHRVAKERQFFDDTTVPAPAGTHAHTPAQLAEIGAFEHTNIASGVLRGIWGVEPTGWPDTNFGTEPSGFDVKYGDPDTSGTGTSNVTEPYLTREYQLCFKCHSNYAYNTPPLLGSFTGGTPPGTNAMTQYTNQGMEYQSPVTHQGEGTSGTPSGAAAAYATNNHRSWHPVMLDTGRTPIVRGHAGMENNWLSPFNLGVGTQTMYCTDCHGSNTAVGTVVPNGGEDGSPWGPHGSNNDFLLKGAWTNNTAGDGVAGPSTTTNHLCFKCHEYDSYGRYINFATQPGGPSGFSLAVGGGVLPFPTQNLHSGHMSVVSTLRCTYCHIAVPHGWKNKVFLVNLNDVGLEGGLAPGTQVRNNTNARYYNGPYYNGSVLKVDSFKMSGQWTALSCGSSGAPGNGQKGTAWMSGGGEACKTLP